MQWDAHFNTPDEQNKKRPLIRQGRNVLLVGDALVFIFLLYNLYVVAGAPAARTDHECT